MLKGQNPMLLSKANDHLTKTPTTVMRRPLLNCWNFQETSKTLLTMAIALGFPKEVEGKSLLMNTLCTSDMGSSGPSCRTDPECLLCKA